jgi:thioredoxin reductase (NADPH)
MYDLIIIGAGPGGIALAAEAQASGIKQSETLILEKAATHNWAIRQRRSNTSRAHLTV